MVTIVVCLRSKFLSRKASNMKEVPAHNHTSKTMSLVAANRFGFSFICVRCFASSFACYILRFTNHRVHLHSANRHLKYII